MAALWGLLRAEVQATVDDFREKGAVGAFKDAALDTRDIAASTGGWLWTSVQDLVADEAPILRAAAPLPGSTAPLEFPDGSVVDALVLDVDSSERRARVQLPTDEMILVEVRGPAVGLAAAVLRVSALPEPGQQVRLHLPAGGRAAATVLEVNAEAEPPRILARAPGVEAPISVLVVLPALPQAAPGAEPQAAAATARPIEREAPPLTLGPQEELGVLDALHQEWRDTVQEFHEKGAVGAVTDAALDAVDIVHDGARTVGTAVQPLAAKAAEVVQPIVDSAHALTVDLLGLDDGEVAAASAAPAASASLSTPAGADVGSSDVFDTAFEAHSAGENAAASYLAACKSSAGGSASASSEPCTTPRSSQTSVAERRNMFEKKKDEEEHEGEHREEGQTQEVQEEFID